MRLTRLPSISAVSAPVSRPLPGRAWSRRLRESRMLPFAASAERRTASRRDVLASQICVTRSAITLRERRFRLNCSSATTPSPESSADRWLRAGFTCGGGSSRVFSRR